MSAEVEQHLSRQAQQMLQIALQLYKLSKLREKKQNQQKLDKLLSEEENLKLQKEIEELELVENSCNDFLADVEPQTREQMELSCDPEVWEKLEPEDARNLWIVADAQKSNDKLTEEQRKYYADFQNELTQKAGARWPDVKLDEMANNLGDIVNVRNLKDLDTVYAVDLSKDDAEDSVTILTKGILKESEDAVDKVEGDALSAQDNEFNMPSRIVDEILRLGDSRTPPLQTYGEDVSIAQTQVTNPKVGR